MVVSGPVEELKEHSVEEDSDEDGSVAAFNLKQVSMSNGGYSSQ